jgi:phenylacetate-CoA ligase
MLQARKTPLRNSENMPENGGVYYDRQEVRNPAEREQALFHALPGLLRHALDNAPHLARTLAGIDPDQIADRRALATLPVLGRSELRDLQRTELPFGGLAATPRGRLARIFASPGPIYDLEGARLDYWRVARAMFAAGFRPGELVHNGFSYHLVPDGSMAEAGARALGCPVIPAGNADPELQARVIADLSPVAYAGPSALLMELLTKVRELGGGNGSLKKALVPAGEPPADLNRLAGELGIALYRCYASADLGLIAYETSARNGLVVDESVIVEIVRPGTGEPVPPGEAGEVVVTAFNPDYPLIRFATGELAAELSGESACGRTNMRLKGPLGPAPARSPAGGRT